jgi:putative selenate reductase FAD-binding subunit
VIEGFHRPTSVPEALRLWAALGRGAFFLGGGTELNHLAGPPGVRHAISLAGLGLGGVAPTDGGLLIGAMTTIQELLESPEVHPLLQRAAARVTNRNVRNVATVGGHVALGKSCADLVPTLAVLGARVLVAAAGGSGAWEVMDYLCARPQGLIVAIEIPAPAPARRFGLAGFKRTANDVSLINAAVALTRRDDEATGLILAMGGVASQPVRIEGVEQALQGRALPARAELEALVADHVRPVNDLRGSSAYKRLLAGTLAADALIEAWTAGEAC